jgi:hypothetical protein
MGYMTETTLIEALEKLALITKNGLDTLIQIQDNANEPLTIGKAIKVIRDHSTDIFETDSYVISGEGIQKIGDEECLGDIVYRVIEDV